MEFKDSYEVISLIEKKKRNGIALRKFKAYMESIGNPQLSLKCIHIGGTNGKGSTSNDIAYILQEAGYRVGLFTSPYLETHHDRIRINGEFIADEDIVNYANKQYATWEQFDLSMFEIDMYIATQYFLDKQVDYAIFEVGMGGDRDATNIVQPLVSAITNVGLDHMEYLGNTHLEIAQKKAGIIKANTAFITSERKEECVQLFKKICEEKNAQMLICEYPKNIRIQEELIFDYQDFHDVHQPTLASYQAQNAGLAIAVVEYLRNHKDIKISDANIYDGLQKALWKGRFEVVHKNPLVIIDGAHNNEGVDALIESLKPFKNMKVIFSALQDKPYHTMVEKLSSVSKDITICEFDFPRAQKAEVIAKGHPVKIIKNYIEAIEEGMRDSEVLLICGSLYFITLAREYFVK